MRALSRLSGCAATILTLCLMAHRVHAAQVCSGVVPIVVRPDSTGSFIVGCDHEYSLKLIPSSSMATIAGIRLPDCSDGPCAGKTGLAAFTCLFGYGYDCCVATGDVLAAEAGSLGGPIKQAVIDRFNRDTDQRHPTCFEDYHGNGARVFVMPIVANAPAPQVAYEVLAFQTFFAKDIPNSSLALRVEAINLEQTTLRSGSWGSVKLIYR